MENVRDIRQKYWDAEAKNGRTDEERKEAVTKFITEELPVWAVKLERTVGENGHAVGNQLLLPDLYVYELIDMFTIEHKEEADAAFSFSATPKLRNIFANVHELVKDWVAARPKTYF